MLSCRSGHRVDVPGVLEQGHEHTLEGGEVTHLLHPSLTCDDDLLPTFPMSAPDGSHIDIVCSWEIPPL